MRRVLLTSLCVLVAAAAAGGQERDPLRVANEIDRLVDRGLAEANITASPPASDC